MFFFSIRVKLGIFGQTAKFGQRPCLFHISKYWNKNKLTRQTVKILMRRLITSRLIWIYTVCKCVSEFTRLYPSSKLRTRVKSGNFGHQVNSDIHLQTVKNPDETAPHQDLTVSYFNLFFYNNN